jgi:signal transduction histidine kinase
LGLPIIKRYLGLLKGDIKVESELEKGTTFHVEMARLGPEDSSL